MFRRRWISLLLCVSMILPLFPQPVVTAEANPTDIAADQTPAETSLPLAESYIIHLQPTEGLRLLSSQEFDGVQILETTDNTLLAEVLPGQDAQTVIQNLERNPEIAAVEPNYYFRATALTTTPNDPRLAEQWAWDEYDLDVVTAWSEVYRLNTNPSAITVAIVDTGIDVTHEDLSENLLIGRNVIRGANVTDYSDNSRIGHGTHLAGIVAATSNNELGISGMSGDLPISVLPVKALDAAGIGSMYDIAQGIIWAADQGSRIINLSFGAQLPDYPKTLADAIAYAQNKGALVVAAAGNDASYLNEFYPAALPGVFSVGATLQTKIQAPFNNQYPDILAPGGNIVSTLPNNTYGSLSGTSQAAAVISGAAALLASAFPDQTAAKYKEALLAGRSYVSVGGVSNRILSADVPLSRISGSYSYLDYMELISPIHRNYGEDARLSGVTDIVTYIEDPSKVGRVDITLINTSTQGSEVLLASIAQADIPESGYITTSFDTTVFADGTYYLETFAFETPTSTSYLENDWSNIIIANTPVNNLEIEIKKPDGTPAAGALVTVYYLRNGSGTSNEMDYVELYHAPADMAGKVMVSSSAATAGNQFLVTARGTDPAFFYYQMVEAPANLVLDSSSCSKISLKASLPSATDLGQREALTGAKVSLELLEKSLPFYVNVNAVVDFNESDNETNLLPLAILNADGETEVWVNPGAYNLRIVQPQQKVYFFDYDIAVSGSDLSLTYEPTENEYSVVKFEPEEFGNGTSEKIFSASFTPNLLTDPTEFELPSLAAGESLILLGGTLSGNLKVEYQTYTYTNLPYIYTYQYNFTNRILVPGENLIQQDRAFSAQSTQETDSVHTIGSYTTLNINILDSFGNALNSTLRRYFHTTYPSNIYPTYEIHDTAQTLLASGHVYSLPFGWYIPTNLTPSTLGFSLHYEDGFITEIDAQKSFNIVSAEDPDVTQPPPFAGLDVSVSFENSPYSISWSQIKLIALQTDDNYDETAGTEPILGSHLQLNSYANLINPQTNLPAQPGDSYAAVVFGEIYSSQGPITYCFSQRITLPRLPANLIITPPELFPVTISAPELPLKYSVYHKDTEGYWLGLQLPEFDNPIEQFLLPLGEHIIAAREDQGIQNLDLNRFDLYYLWQKIMVDQDGTNVTFDVNNTASLQVQPKEPNSTEYEPALLAIYPEDLPFSPVFNMAPVSYIYYADYESPTKLLHVTPGSYRLEGVMIRSHMDASWSHWLQKEEPMVLNANTVGTWTLGYPFDDASSEISFVESSRTTFQPEEVIEIQAQISDGSGNRLVGSGINIDWQFGIEASSMMSIQTYDKPAPYFILSNAENHEVLRLYNEPSYWKRLYLWKDMQEGKTYFSSARYLNGDSTFFGTRFSLPKGSLGGIYTLQMLAPAGPDQLLQRTLTFDLEAQHAAPSLQPIKAAFKESTTTLTGTSVALSQLTGSLTYEQEAPIEFSLGTVSADRQFSVEIPSEHLIREGIYILKVKSQSGELISDWSVPQQFLVDRTPPTSVLNPVVVSPDANTVKLNWQAPSIDLGSAIASYQIQRNGQVVTHVINTGSTTEFEYLNTELIENTSYTYEIRAVDAAGNVGSAEAIVITTGTEKDVIAPSIPRELSQTLNQFSVTLTWKPASDNILVMGYKVYRERLVEAAYVAEKVWDTEDAETLTFTEPDLLLGNSTYKYTVTAYDTVGNESLRDAQVLLTTRPLLLQQIRWTAARNLNGSLKAKTLSGTAATVEFTLLGDSSRVASVELQWVKQTASDTEEFIHEEVTLTEQLDTSQQGTGVYKGAWTIATDAKQINSAKAILNDATGEGVTRFAERLPLYVAGHLTVTVPENPSRLLDGAILKIWSISTNSGGQMRITGAGEFTFRELMPAADYVVTLTTANQFILSEVAAVEIQGNSTRVLTLTPLYPATVKLKVVNDLNVNLTNAAVEIFDLQSTLLASGSSDTTGMVPRIFDQIGNTLKPGTLIRVSVTPPANLLTKYQELNKMPFTLVEGENLIECQLPARGKATLTGTMTLRSDTSLALVGATVRAYQTINEIETLINFTKTDATGKYSLEIISNLPVTLRMTHRSIAAKDFVITDLIAANTTFIFDYECPMEKTLGVLLYAQEFNEPEYLMEIDWRVAVHVRLRIKNLGTLEKPKNQSYNIYGIQDYLLPIPDGEPGDRIVIEADGVECGMDKQSVEVTLDSNSFATAEIHLKKRGSFSATVIDTMGNLHDGTKRYAQVFRWNGASYEYLDTVNSINSFIRTSLLNQGMYAFVFSWGPLPETVLKDGIWLSARENFPLLKEMMQTPDEKGNSLGFVLEDLELSRVNQTLGTIRLPVPQNVRAGYFRGMPGNGLSFAKDQATPGTILTLRGTYKKVSTDSLKDLKLLFGIPTGATLITDSVSVQRNLGNQDPKIIMRPDAIELNFGATSAELLEGSIYYMVRLPLHSATTEIFAKMWAEYMTYGYNREEINQPSVKMPVVTINAPPEITEPNQEITVGGSASPLTSVKVYDGSELLTETRSNDAGFWTATVVLPDRGSPAHHYLRAEVMVSANIGDTTLPQWPEAAAITVSEITPESVTLTWPSATDDTQLSHYVLNFYDDLGNFLTARSLSPSEGNTSESLKVENLVGDTSYHVSLRAADTSLNWSTELTGSFATPAQDLESPAWQGSAITISTASFSGLKLFWPEATDNNAMKEYRVYVSPAHGSLTRTAILPLTTRQLDVTGLYRGQTYVFHIDAVDIYGNISPLTYTHTVPLQDTVAPTWPLSATIEVAKELDTEVQLHWTPAEDQMQVYRYRIERLVGESWVGTATSYSNSATLPGLAPETEYHLRVLAEDLGYNLSATALECTVSTTAQDRTTPTWPEGAVVSISEKTNTSFVMSWPEAQDMSGIRDYRVLILDEVTQKYNTFNTRERSARMSGYTRGQIIQGYIAAVDTRGNTTPIAQGLAFNVTIAPEDATPPTWPANSAITIHEVAPTLVQLSWTAADDDTMQYLIQAIDGSGAVIRSETVGKSILQWPIGGLLAQTSYTIKVEAKDQYDNTTSTGPSTDITTPLTDNSAPWWPNNPALSVTRMQIGGDGTYYAFFSWSKATDYNLKYYELTAVDEFGIAPSSSPTYTQQPSWHLWSLIPGRTYTVTLVAEDHSGHRSQALTTVVRIPGAEQVTLLEAIDPNINNTPTLVIASEPAKVTYDTEAVHITQVTMQQTDGRKVSFAPVGKFPYVFVPGYGFQFDVEFDKPERVEEVRVHSESGAQVGGSVAPGGAAQPNLGFIALGGQFTGNSNIPGPIYVSTVQTPATFQLAAIAPYSQEAVRSSLPAPWAYAELTEEITTDETAGTTSIHKTGNLSDPRMKIDTTMTFQPLDEHTENPADVARINAGGAPVYDLVWDHSVSTEGTTTTVTVTLSAVVNAEDVKFVDPELMQVLSAAGTGAQVAKKLAITLKGDHILTDGLNLGDLAMTLMGADDLSEYQKSLDDLLNNANGDCPAADVRMYKEQIEFEKESAMWRTVTKNGLSLVSIGLGIAIPGLGFAIGSYAVGKLTEFAIDSEQDEAFADIKKGIDMNDFCKPKKKEFKKELVADPTWILDPSGIAYEVTTDHPIEGATASLYQNVNGVWTLWDATWYEQTNPLTTDSLGRYAWDVPVGEWKVVLNKEGYTQAESASLLVPPPQLDINIPMNRTTLPQVQTVEALPQGRGLRLVFDQYMKISSLQSGVVHLFESTETHNEITGAILAQNAVTDPQDATQSLAKEFYFTTDRLLVENEAVQIQISETTQAYTGLSLLTAYQADLTVHIPVAVSSVQIQPAQSNLALGAQATFAALVQPSNATLTTVTWSSDRADLISVSPTGVVTALAVGQATLTATTLDGGFRASAVINVYVPSPVTEDPESDPAPQPKPPVVVEPQELSFFGDTVLLVIPMGAFPVDLQLQTEQISDPLTTLDKQIFTQASPLFVLQTGGINPTTPLSLTLAYCHVCLLGGDPRLTGIYRQDDENPDLYHYVGGVVDPDAHTVMTEIQEPGTYVILSHDPQFNDLSSHWAENDCGILAARNVLQGTGGGHFEPDRAITRAEFTRLLLNMDRILQVSTQNQQHSMTFGDVQPQDWFYTDITAAAANGWVSGSYGNFRPNQTISRQEMAVMLQNMLGTLLPQVPMTQIQGLFSDANNTALWAQEALTLAVSLGLIKGMDGTLQPEGEATRAQAASLILRCLEMLGQITKPVSQQGILRANSDENLPFEMTDTDGNPIYVLPQNEGVSQQLAALVLSGQTVILEGIWSRESTSALHGRLLKVWSLK